MIFRLPRRVYVELSDADADRLIERIEGDTRLSDATVERAADGRSATCEYSFVAGSLTAAVLESEELLAAAFHEIDPRYGRSDIETSAEYGG